MSINQLINWPLSQIPGIIFCIILLAVLQACSVPSPEAFLAKQFRKVYSLLKIFSVNYLKRPPIEWNFEGHYLAIGPNLLNKKNFVFSFQCEGRNNSRNPINNFSGIIRSNITNKAYPIFVVIRGTPTTPENTNGIPPNAKFQLVAPFMDNFPEGSGIDPTLTMEYSDFERGFSDFTFEFKYGKRVFKKHFTDRKIRKYLEDHKQRCYPPKEYPMEARTKPLPGTPV